MAGTILSTARSSSPTEILEDTETLRESLQDVRFWPPRVMRLLGISDPHRKNIFDVRVSTD